MEIKTFINKGEEEDKLLCTYVVCDNVFNIFDGMLIVDENNNIVARVNI